MDKRRKRPQAFTLAELTVVIVIIGILAALLLPAVLKGRHATDVARAKQRISTVTLALDAFYNDFGYYPPTGSAFNPSLGEFGGDPVLNYGDFGYSEALVHCLCNKWTKGTGDAKVIPADIGLLKGTGRLIGGSPVTTAGAYLEVRVEDLVDKDGDGWLELADPWGYPYIYIPKQDYLKADGSYNAGALVWKDDTGDNVPDPPDVTVVPLENVPYQRDKFQLISIGPDGWTPGLDPTPKDAGNGKNWIYFDISIDKPAPVNPHPEWVGTDDDMASPKTDAVHKDQTADDLTNLK